ncbi:MAG: alanine/ornithine racemase family PLP-dependent enzyme [Chitinophagaceae bacterium]|nr:MAG: alanine/ornithine racemase family PLP-dependent enzyme [Chitinophagaceae bacterium]
MAFVKLYKDRLRHNYLFLNDLFKEYNIDWGVVSKLLCGNELFIKELMNLNINEIHDSRISNLKKVKELNPNVQTVYIKPPPKRSIPSIIRYADVSFNTESDTIELLSKEAVKQKKKHKIIIMIEMGDLREGVMGDDLVDFYGQIFKLPNIEVVGLGTNLNCLHGIMPSQDKLIQLGLYKQIIEAKFNIKIPWVSGGTSVMIPLLYRKQLPKAVNHFRVGETLFFGINLFTDKLIKGMKGGVFQLYTEIIELTEKPVLPSGELGTNPSGDKAEINPELYGKTSYRAIIDIGLLDIDPKFLIPKDKNISISGASSDMIVIELGKNPKNYKVGDLIAFELKYMGALAILNSYYIEKVVE